MAFPFKLPLILDGATGTGLYKLGMPAGCSTERFVTDNPETIIKIQNEYISAGSDCVYSPTFGGNSLKIKSYGEDPNIYEINKNLALISKSITKDSNKLVGGDISPSGKMLYPFGELTVDESMEIYREQIRGLIDADVDFFICETMMSLSEARAAVLEIKKQSNKPIFVTFTVDENGNTLSGNPILTCLITMQELGVSACGTNCSTGPMEMLENLKKLIPYSNIPIIAKPNAGVPDGTGGEKLLSPNDFATFAENALNLGVGILGGCCGTDAHYIEKINNVTKNTSFNNIIENNSILKYATSERVAVKLDNLTVFSSPILCDDNFEDSILDDESDILTIEINSDDDLRKYYDNLFLISKPVAFISSNLELIEKAVKNTCGISVIIPRDIDLINLEPIKNLYGCIIKE